MKQKPDFAYGRFAADVERGLGALSLRQYVRVKPWLNISMLSRAVNSMPLSPPNLLAVCDAFGLDPMDYFSVQKQAVSADVSRETIGSASRGISAPPLSGKPLAGAPAAPGGVAAILGRMRGERA